MPPHTSDCSFWVNEPCDCMYRFDACDMYKDYRDRMADQVDGMDMVLTALVNGAGNLPLAPPFYEEEK